MTVPATRLLLGLPAPYQTASLMPLSAMDGFVRGSAPSSLFRFQLDDGQHHGRMTKDMHVAIKGAWQDHQLRPSISRWAQTSTEARFHRLDHPASYISSLRHDGSVPARPQAPSAVSNFIPASSSFPAISASAPVGLGTRLPPRLQSATSASALGCPLGSSRPPQCSAIVNSTMQALYNQCFTRDNWLQLPTLPS